MNTISVNVVLTAKATKTKKKTFDYIFLKERKKKEETRKKKMRNHPPLIRLVGIPCYHNPPEGRELPDAPWCVVYTRVLAHHGERRRKGT